MWAFTVCNELVRLYLEICYCLIVSHCTPQNINYLVPVHISSVLWTLNVKIYHKLWQGIVFKRKSCLEHLVWNHEEKIKYFKNCSLRNDPQKSHRLVACSVRNTKNTKYAPKGLISHSIILCVDQTIILNGSFVATKLHH